MGNFIAIVPRAPLSRRSGSLQRGIELAQRLKRQTLADMVERAWGSAAAFRRANGSAATIATDDKSQSWLLAPGTWFHRDGFASGAESQLLASYLKSGARVLARALDGFFCVVIGDGRTNETIVITDVAGSYHCFVRETPEGLAIAGSSLLLAGLGDFHLDPLACLEFFRTGVVYEDRSCYAEVRKLGPASISLFRDGASSVNSGFMKISSISL